MKDRFFDKVDWAAFWTATLATFAVYFLTLGPSVGLEDSGELATAGAHLGVPHPPGYPFWTLCSWLFCKVFSWVRYMGHPTPAWAISCFSAVAGALAAGCTAMLICRSSRDFAGGGEDGLDDVSPQPPSRISTLVSFAGGVAGAVTFSLSPVEWSQSTIVEIYSLNALFLMWVFLLSYRWMRKPSDRVLWLTAFVFGLGLTNYQVLVFAIVPLALIIFMKDRAMFRDVFIYLVPVALTYQALQIGALDRASYEMKCDVIAKHLPVLATKSCPSTAMTVLGVVALVGSIAAACLLKSRGEAKKARDVALYGGAGGAAAIFLAGTVFTSPVEWSGIFIPVAPLVEPSKYALGAAFVAASVAAAAVAALQDDSKSLKEGPALKWLVASGALALGAVLVAASVPQAGLMGYFGAAYPWGKSTFMLLALLAALFAMCFFTKRGLCFAIPAAGLHLAVFVLLRHGAMNGLTHPQSWWFCWPIAWNFVLLALAALTLPHGRSVAGAAFFAQLGVSFYAYMPIVSDLRNPPMNWGYPRTWEGFKHAIQRGQYEAIGFPEFNGVSHFLSFVGNQMRHYFQDVKMQFTDLLIPFAFVPFAAGHWVVAKARRKTFWQWMVAAAACFVMMSFLLILLANVKGDVQDGFIQKVKFISSHAMIALWIGYGIVFAGILVARLAMKRGAKTAFFAALAFSAAVAVAAFVSPIVANYTDRRMVFELGGCEQNAHTFGWQFGAFQLDGAKAIREFLEADEEPLPDPDWPPAMEPFSIFFGGTDPGRFVPTYMIYSARFRPDVYLITQNALADDTYMSVERDLYGDEIWIPSKADSEKAFSTYVSEVELKKREQRGQIKIENGRVQVTGALGVMDINGILAQNMFEHDRLRHAFYVEESYAIPWMYDYLSPHGLIMKINAEKTPFRRDVAVKDRDFWDWYLRRTVRDPMYRRDFAAQKSFSKLRAAEAGLYARQGRVREAADAYREALLFYPASPEAMGRYIEDVLYKFLKYDVIMDLVAYTDEVDPNNKRTAPFRHDIPMRREMQSSVFQLEAARRSRPLTKEEDYRLAQGYRLLCRGGEAARILAKYVDEEDSFGNLKGIALCLFDEGMDKEAERAVVRCLRKSTLDAELWLVHARLRFRAGDMAEAVKSLGNAFQVNRDFANEMATRTPEIDQIFKLSQKKAGDEEEDGE